jgi:DMSO/TMAO reductase YedYZ molybdopterin-dependent catalytic subunit
MGFIMSTRTVNLAMLSLLVVVFVSGIATYFAGAPDNRWVFWSHRVAGFALVPLLIWKAGIVAGSYRKRGLTLSTTLSAVAGALFLSSLVYGVLWATTGVRGMSLPVIGTMSGLGVHIALGIALLPLLVIHVIGRWPQIGTLRRPDFAGRRASLRYLALGVSGLLLWQGTESASAAAGLPGAQRRFTGSRERGSLSGNGYPVTNWYSDPRPLIDVADWRLRIGGETERAVTLTWEDLLDFPLETARVTLDCTGGWYTEQDWSGVPVAALIDAAGARRSARSLVFRSETGYLRRYPLDEAERLLLAIQVGDELLSRGHGYPVRLVVPGRRGYDWVKWVVEIEVSDAPAWLGSPLPLQ